MAEVIKDIIAERKLIFVTDKGERFECRLVFGQIFDEPDKGVACPYQIIGYGDERMRFGYGVDSLQAFLIAVEKANVELAYTFNEGNFFFNNNPELLLEARDLR